MSARAGWLAVALAAAIGARGAQLASAPGFAVAVAPPVRDALRLEGVRASLRADGAIVVTAASAQPGHERVGTLWVGIPSFVELRGVDVRCTDAAQPFRRLQAASARWDGAALALDGPVRVESSDGAFAATSARVVDGQIVVAR